MLMVLFAVIKIAPDTVSLPLIVKVPVLLIVRLPTVSLTPVIVNVGACCPT